MLPRMVKDRGEKIVSVVGEAGLDLLFPGFLTPFKKIYSLLNTADEDIRTAIIEDMKDQQDDFHRRLEAVEKEVKKLGSDIGHADSLFKDRLKEELLQGLRDNASKEVRSALKNAIARRAVFPAQSDRGLMERWWRLVKALPADEIRGLMLIGDKILIVNNHEVRTLRQTALPLTLGTRTHHVGTGVVQEIATAPLGLPFNAACGEVAVNDEELLALQDVLRSLVSDHKLVAKMAIEHLPQGNAAYALTPRGRAVWNLIREPAGLEGT